MKDRQVKRLKEYNTPVFSSNSLCLQVTKLLPSFWIFLTPRPPPYPREPLGGNRIRSILDIFNESLLLEADGPPRAWANRLQREVKQHNDSVSFCIDWWQRTKGDLKVTPPTSPVDDRAKENSRQHVARTNGHEREAERQGQGVQGDSKQSVALKHNGS